MNTLLISVLALGAVYWFYVRRFFTRWGASDLDLRRPMAGDSAVADPDYTATLTVTIDARPEHVWPWLVQMGYRRGGLYSYDWLDRLFGYLDGPSANQVLPQFQRLDVGDVIPVGRGPGFPVTALEPGQSLVLSGAGKDFAWAWQFGLFPISPGRTRLVSRNTVRLSPTLGAWLLMRLLEPATFLMTRRMLLGLKSRAEDLAAATSAQHGLEPHRERAVVLF
jgi:hypothetical protein